MKTLITVLFVAIVLSPVSATAQHLTFESTKAQVGLLELYTSEGCSSCPPADRWLTGLKNHPDLWHGFIPVALHVDYWDYIGWNDPFASPTFAQRQRQYAKERSLKAVYTPGFVYNGKEWRQWYTSRKADFPPGATPGVMRLQLENHSAAILFTPTIPSGEALTVNLAVLGFGLETQVRAGENRGKTLTHDFVVLGVSHAVAKPSNKSYAIKMKLPQLKTPAPSYGVVAWISKRQHLGPIQAVGGTLPAEYSLPQQPVLTQR